MATLLPWPATVNITELLFKVYNPAGHYRYEFSYDHHKDHIKKLTKFLIDL